MSMPWPEALARIVDQTFAHFGIWMLRSIASVAWFLGKCAAYISRLFMEGNLWARVRDPMLEAMRQAMPDALENLIKGSGGLFYIALMVAGVLMIIPVAYESRLVKLDKALIWAVIMLALFVSGTLGYDVIEYVERLRVWGTEAIARPEESSGLNELVARPMRATETESARIDFDLPADFVDTHFPEPLDEETITIIFFDGILEFEADWLLESQNSLTERRQMGSVGTALALLTLGPAYVLLLFGLIFALLTASAVMLILFFIAGLPLGFFEFGSTLLNGILRQYGYVFALSFLISVFTGLLGSIGLETFLPGDTLDLPHMLVYLATLAVVAIGLQAVVRMAWSAMTGSFGLFGRSVTAMSQMATAGLVGAGSGGLLSTGARVATGVLLGAATGGISTAVMAGAGSLLAKTKAGGALAEIAGGASPARKNAHVFASAARAHGVSNVASGLLRARRMNPDHPPKKHRLQNQPGAPKAPIGSPIQTEPGLALPFSDNSAQLQLHDMEFSQPQLESLHTTVRSMNGQSGEESLAAVASLKTAAIFEGVTDQKIARAVELALLAGRQFRLPLDLHPPNNQGRMQ